MKASDLLGRPCWYVASTVNWPAVIVGVDNETLSAQFVTDGAHGKPHLCHFSGHQSGGALKLSDDFDAIAGAVANLINVEKMAASVANAALVTFALLVQGGAARFKGQARMAATVVPGDPPARRLPVSTGGDRSTVVQIEAAIPGLTGKARGDYRFENGIALPDLPVKPLPPDADSGIPPSPDQPPASRLRAGLLEVPSQLPADIIDPPAKATTPPSPE